MVYASLLNGVHISQNDTNTHLGVIMSCAKIKLSGYIMYYGKLK